MAAPFVAQSDMTQSSEAIGIVVIWLMLLGPALFGLAALVFGLKLLKRAKRGGENQKILKGFAALLLLAAFGVGTCYTLMFAGGLGIH
jgi:hypothetical protein